MSEQDRADAVEERDNEGAPLDAAGRAGRRTAAAVALAAGFRQTDAADSAGIHVGTLRRWMREPAFVAEVEAEREHFATEARGNAAVVRAHAWRRLAGLIDIADARTALAACRVALSASEPARRPELEPEQVPAIVQAVVLVLGQLGQSGVLPAPGGLAALGPGDQAAEVWRALVGRPVQEEQPITLEEGP